MACFPLRRIYRNFCSVSFVYILAFCSINLYMFKIFLSRHYFKEQIRSWRNGMNVDCEKSARLESNEPQEPNVLEYKPLSDLSFGRFTSNCDQLFTEFHFEDHKKSGEKSAHNSSLAYILLPSTPAELTLEFIHSTYHSTNTYCVHLDLHAERSFKLALLSLSYCLPNNLIIASRSYDTKKRLGKVNAAFKCFDDLALTKRSYSYAIIIDSNVIPIRKDKEIKQILENIYPFNIVHLKYNSEASIARSNFPFSSHFTAALSDLSVEAIRIKKKLLLGQFMRHQTRSRRDSQELFWALLTYQQKYRLPGGIPIESCRKTHFGGKAYGFILIGENKTPTETELHSKTKNDRFLFLKVANLLQSAPNLVKCLFKSINKRESLPIHESEYSDILPAIYKEWTRKWKFFSNFGC